MRPAVTRKRKRTEPGSEPPPARGQRARSTQQEQLLHLLWIVEHVNADAASLGYGAHAATDHVHLSAVLAHTQARLAKGPTSSRRSAVLEALEQARLLPRPNPELLELQFAWLSASSRADRHEPLHVTERLLPDVKQLSVPARFLEETLVAPAPGAAQPLDTASDLCPIALVDEALDPIAVLLDYLRTDLCVPSTLVEHELQRFLRHVFDLSFRRHYVLLANVCANINRIHYDRASFSLRAIHAPLTPIVRTSALLQSMREELQRSVERFDKERRTQLLRNAEATTVGLFLALRFCQLTRVRFQVPDERAQDAPQATEHAPLMRSMVSLLHPLEYSNVRSRIFGSLSGIEGMNAVFGGGLLPNVDLGRVWVVAGQAGTGKSTLALHLGCDMAARRQLVIYFSFEESYRNISERAVVFRLYRPDRFVVDAVDADTLEQRISSGYDDPKEPGMLLFYNQSGYDLAATLQHIRETVEKHAPNWAQSTAIVLDSVDALRDGSGASEGDTNRFGRRLLLRELFRLLEESRFWGVVLTERDNPELPTLQHLADTYIELSTDEAVKGRSLQVHKCRLQDFMPGKHGYQMLDSRGVAIIPNLSAIQRAVRRRSPVQLSESRLIPLPAPLQKVLPEPALRDHCSVFIWGNRRSGRRLFLLNLLTEPSRRVPPAERGRRADPEAWTAGLTSWPKDAVGTLVVVTFSTPPPRFVQTLQTRDFIQTRWERCPRRQLRWYQPGPELTAERVIGDLRQTILDARIAGHPVERIAFDEIEAIEHLFPNVAREAAFWPTVFALLASEGITAFYGLRSESDAEPRFADSFVPSMDYALRLWRAHDPGSQEPMSSAEPRLPAEHAFVRMYKHPPPANSLTDRAVPISVLTDGRIIWRA